MQQSLKVVQTKMNNIISILDIIFFFKRLLIDRKTSIQIFYLKHCLKTYEKQIQLKRTLSRLFSTTTKNTLEKGKNNLKCYNSKYIHILPTVDSKLGDYFSRASNLKELNCLFFLQKVNEFTNLYVYVAVLPKHKSIGVLLFLYLL